MNREKVLELAQQADVWIAGQAPYQEQLERFAKLIVRECVSVAMEQYDDAEPWGGVQEVLKHFGVKE